MKNILRKCDFSACGKRNETNLSMHVYIPDTLMQRSQNDINLRKNTGKCGQMQKDAKCNTLAKDVGSHEATRIDVTGSTSLTKRQADRYVMTQKKDKIAQRNKKLF